MKGFREVKENKGPRLKRRKSKRKKKLSIIKYFQMAFLIYLFLSPLHEEKRILVISKGGKLTLIKSALSNVPIYMMSLFWMLKKVKVR